MLVIRPSAAVTCYGELPFEVRTQPRRHQTSNASGSQRANQEKAA